jgi:predicted porin
MTCADLRAMRRLLPLLAFVPVAIPSAAPAQGSLSIAGGIDVGPQFIQNGGAGLRRVDSGVYTASRIIVKGTEDLGGGLGALFYLASRFGADTGAPLNPAKFWNAGSYVGLGSKRWGTLTFGRQYLPMYWSFLGADDSGPQRLHGYSAVQLLQRSQFARIAAAASPIKRAGSLDTLAGGVYTLNLASAFEDKLAIYTTPAMAGVTAILAAGAPEGYAAGNGRVFAGNVEYRNGSFYSSVAHTRKQGRVPVAGAEGEFLNERLASAMYAITPGLKLWGNAHRWVLESAGGRLEGRDWMLGASRWWGSNELWINCASKALDDCRACGSRAYAVGYHHLLSKRAELYAAVARTSNDANAGGGVNGFYPINFGRSVRGIAAGVALTF